MSDNWSWSTRFSSYLFISIFRFLPTGEPTPVTVIATHQGKQSRRTAGEGAVRMTIQVLHIPQVDTKKQKFIGVLTISKVMLMQLPRNWNLKKNRFKNTIVGGYNSFILISFLFLFQMIPDQLISTTANQCLHLHLFHHCPERTVNPPDLPLASFPAAVIKDTQLFHFIVLITCHTLPSHTPHIITQTRGTMWSPPITQVFTKTFSILVAEAALLAPPSRGRMMTMPLQPHRAATPSTQRTWTMILTTDALTTSLCSDVILCVCVWLCFTSTCTTIHHTVLCTRDRSQDFVYADLPKTLSKYECIQMMQEQFFMPVLNDQDTKLELIIRNLQKLGKL